MRIKFNDKIYRLKEIESGVDSLMELVEEQKYKNGDFVYEDGRIMIVKSYPNFHHANVWHTHSDEISYNETYAVDFSAPTFRHATEEERQILIDALAEDGKRWNDDKKCIEDIPQQKFKVGDKVKIRDGVSSKTIIFDKIYFNPSMDFFIGKQMVVEKNRIVADCLCVECKDLDGVSILNIFKEDWLEPCSDEPKKGDLAIFWDYDKADANITIYDKKDHKYHSDISGIHWENAIKFESKEQFEKILRGEI